MFTTKTNPIPLAHKNRKAQTLGFGDVDIAKQVHLRDGSTKTDVYRFPRARNARGKKQFHERIKKMNEFAKHWMMIF